jgi:hypothetical protein
VFCNCVSWRLCQPPCNLPKVDRTLLGALDRPSLVDPHRLPSRSHRGYRKIRVSWHNSAAIPCALSAKPETREQRILSTRLSIAPRGHTADDSCWLAHPDSKGELRFPSRRRPHRTIASPNLPREHAANFALILVHDKEKSREKWNKVLFIFSRNRGSYEICQISA